MKQFDKNTEPETMTSEPTPDTHSALQDLPPTPLLLSVQFTGTGQRYFSVWFINGLLNLVSLGLFWPFAQARKRAFFHRHTRLGLQALAFDADPWKQFQTHLLLIGLCLLNALVYLFKPELLWLPALLLALLWPALWHASLALRFNHTQWRGLRLRCVGSVAQAYGVVLPLCLPALFGVLLVSLKVSPAWTEFTKAQMLLGPLGLALLGVVLALPWQLVRLHSFVRGGWVCASEHSELNPFFLAKAAYLLKLKMLGISALMATTFTCLAAVQARAGLDAGLAVTVVMTCLAFPLVLMPYHQAQMQNLLWHHTRSKHLRFHSALQFGELFWVNLQNWTLIALTLGLYWPFAVMRITRLRLTALTVLMEGDESSWAMLDSTAQEPLQSRHSDGPQMGLQH